MRYTELRKTFEATDDQELLAGIASQAPPADESEIISLMFIIALDLRRRGMPRDRDRQDTLAGAVDQLGKALQSRAAMH